MHIIISRYKENIDWINNINQNINITVYNKFYQETNLLQNVGREGHTYLNHIINHYDNLDDIMVFLQGNPLDHYTNIIKDINDFYESHEHNIHDQHYTKFLSKEYYEGVYGNNYRAHKNGLPIYYFFDLLFNIKLEPKTRLKIFYGGQFIVHKNNILNRPKDFYIFLIKFLSYEVDPIEGYILERLWPYILDPKITISNKYKLWS